VTSVLVDSNVLIDVITDDPAWGAWSSEALQRIADESVLVINALIYAELSVGFDAIEALEAALPQDVFRREPLPFEAGFLAGRAFGHYRAAGGARRSPLPDFYIGAHAAVAGHGLLTRDAGRYRTYFPSLRVIAPDA